MQTRHDNPVVAPYSSLFHLFDEMPLTSLYRWLRSHFKVSQRVDLNDYRAATEILVQAELSERDRFDLCTTAGKLLRNKLNRNMTLSNAVQLAAVFTLIYCTCYMLGCLIYVHENPHSSDAPSNLAVALLHLFGTMASGYVVLAPTSMATVGNSAARTILVTHAGPESLTLLHSLYGNRPPVRIQHAIARAVKMIDVTWYDRMPSGSTKLLASRALFNSANEPWKIDAIRALQYVGRASEVRTLERLTGEKYSPAVREAANTALEALQERLEAETERGTLLRGSSAAPGDLLRAVSEPEGNIAELLIAAEGTSSREEG
jgi:hypothetical protein